MVEPQGFCSQSRLVIVAGKGGVGKTAVTAALARVAAGAGLSALVLEIEGKAGLAASFGAPVLDYDEQEVVAAGELGPGSAPIRARTLTPDDALLEYLDDHGLRRISRRLVRSGVVDVVSTAAPGIKDIVLLGKVKQLEQRGEDDLIVLDAPAAGHAVTFLRSAAALLDTVSGGPIRDQAEEVQALLTDPARCRVLLVTLPEETPVNEAVETAFALEDEVGVDLTPVVVNRVLEPLQGLDIDPAVAAGQAGMELTPDRAQALAQAAAFRQRRQELQGEQLDRLATALPLPQLHLPALLAADIGPDESKQLSEALAVAIQGLEVEP